MQRGLLHAQRLEKLSDALGRSLNTVRRNRDVTYCYFIASTPVSAQMFLKPKYSVPDAVR